VLLLIALLLFNGRIDMVAEKKIVPRLLYVEDEKDLQTCMVELFNLLGYEVACADNGRQGVEKAESWQPDIILMDVRMPVMNGYEAIEVLRSKPQTHNIPIFMLTAYTDYKTRTSCKKVGADGFFAKPPDISKIDKTIKSHLHYQEK